MDRSPFSSNLSGIGPPTFVPPPLCSGRKYFDSLGIEGDWPTQGLSFQRLESERFERKGVSGPGGVSCRDKSEFEIRIERMGVLIGNGDAGFLCLESMGCGEYWGGRVDGGESAGQRATRHRPLIAIQPR